MERIPDLRAEVVDPLVGALEELAEAEAYHLEAPVMLQASSTMTLKRVAQVKYQYRRMSRRRI